MRGPWSAISLWVAVCLLVWSGSCLPQSAAAAKSAKTLLYRGFQLWGEGTLLDVLKTGFRPRMDARKPNLGDPKNLRDHNEAWHTDAARNTEFVSASTQRLTALEYATSGGTKDGIVAVIQPAENFVDVARSFEQHASIKPTRWSVSEAEFAALHGVPPQQIRGFIHVKAADFAKVLGEGKAKGPDVKALDAIIPADLAKVDLGRWLQNAEYNPAFDKASFPGANPKLLDADAQAEFDRIMDRIRKMYHVVRRRAETFCGSLRMASLACR
ncbi:hypothetical protein HIM_00752 [Hirsutella minnesotensis 3608]|nr:hypothetical protein HIM_00752 [Hirsutella minnesotensis 3608]